MKSGNEANVSELVYMYLFISKEVDHRVASLYVPVYLNEKVRALIRLTALLVEGRGYIIIPSTANPSFLFGIS